MKIFLTKGEFLMASAAFSWGFSYIFIKLGLVDIGPVQLGAMRFAIAFPLLLLLFRKKAIPNKKELGYGFALGLMIALLTLGYNIGLKTTSASMAGFLAGTTVAMVPLLNIPFVKKCPQGKTILCIIFTLIGTGFLSVAEGLSISSGCWFCLGGALAYAFQIIITDRAFKVGCRAIPIAVFQLGFCALILTIVALILESFTFYLSPVGWLSVLGLAVVSSAFGYMAQTFAQRDVRPERIGFLYALEPVFCAILAFLIFGETMTLTQWTGALLIVISIVIG